MILWVECTQPEDQWDHWAHWAHEPPSFDVAPIKEMGTQRVLAVIMLKQFLHVVRFIVRSVTSQTDSVGQGVPIQILALQLSQGEI